MSKILTINTSDSGGAGIAATRLHFGLKKNGIQGLFLCLNLRYGNDSELHKFRPTPLNFKQRQLRRFGFFNTQQEKNKSLLKGKEKKYEIFSFPLSGFDISAYQLVKEADLIHLHWVANFLDWPSFFSKIDKPVVWTLHDMNPFQGGFHYHEDVIRNEAEFGTLEKRLREIKKKSLEGIQNLTIVTPTRWLMEESSKSEILGRFPHYHFNNGLDPKIFKPYPREVARDVFQLPKGKKILLFVSDNTSNRRKGLDLLLGALSQIKIESLLVVAIGYKPQEVNSNNQIQYLGRISDERLMALAYAASDAFVIPSREDNLPNTMLEALSCGIPVIGTPVGGIKEVIRTGFNGILAEEISSPALASAIERFFDGSFSFSSSEIRDNAVEKFNIEHIANQYIDLYKRILNNE